MRPRRWPSPTDAPSASRGLHSRDELVSQQLHLLRWGQHVRCTVSALQVGRQGSTCRGCGVLLTAQRGALPPCDAPGRDVAIRVTRAAVQTYPQVREERGQQCHPHEVAEDGAGASRWSRAARTAPDARDAPAVRLAGRARAAREECPVARSGPRHRLTALCHKWDCREHALRFTRVAPRCVEVTGRDR